MTREEKLQKAHQIFDNRNLLTELKWQREYFNRGYVSKQEELFNLWIFDECIKALEQEPRKGHWLTKIKSDLRGDKWPTNPKCSECGGEPYYSNTIYNYKFCPYCGAKMEGAEE